MADMEEDIVRLTHKWCDDIRGQDCRIAVGACMNVITTIGNYSPADVRTATAMFLRRIADELEAGVPNEAQQH
jgi:hypothetical protein